MLLPVLLLPSDDLDFLCSSSLGVLVLESDDMDFLCSSSPALLLLPSSLASLPFTTVHSSLYASLTTSSDSSSSSSGMSSYSPASFELRLGVWIGRGPGCSW
uniref:Uncharacterized protein n=1 Tax=Arundo donax TaxID=35708 RepID=A0A0A9GJQ2_ARUDO